jgi:hypothetical protein
VSKQRPVENDVKDRIKELLTAHGWEHWPNAASRFGVGGLEDRSAIRGKPGGGCHFLAVEAKLDKLTGTARQEARLARVRAKGGIAVVVSRRNLHKFEALLVQISKDYPLTEEPTPSGKGVGSKLRSRELRDPGSRGQRRGQ